MKKDYTMFDYADRIKKDLENGYRIMVNIDGIPTPATKKDVIDAVKNFKTVERIR